MYGISRVSWKSHTSKQKSAALPKACVEKSKEQRPNPNKSSESGTRRHEASCGYKRALNDNSLLIVIIPDLSKIVDGCPDK